MNWNRSLSIVFVLVMASPVRAQVHHQTNRGAQGGGMHGRQIHSGQGQHPGMIHPQQQMENDFWQHQMMLNELMAPRRSTRHQGQAPTMPRQSPSARIAHPNVNQAQNGSSQVPTGRRGKSPRSNHNEDAQAASPGMTGHPDHQANGKAAKQAKGASLEVRNTKNRETQAHTHSGAANKATRAADLRTAALLRAVHANLEKADTVYQGHRVQAMHHVAAAINHLGANAVSTTAFEYGGGNIPQAHSDRILDDAIFQLRRIEGDLGMGPNSLAHHGHARTQVAEAIGQLETARRIR